MSRLRLGKPAPLNQAASEVQAAALIPADSPGPTMAGSAADRGAQARAYTQAQNELIFARSFGVG
jgi:hypothetical protein